MAGTSSTPVAGTPPPFPYGRDYDHTRRVRQLLGNLNPGDASDLYDSVHEGAAAKALGAVERLPQPSRQDAYRVVQGVTGGAIPQWQWQRGPGRSNYNLGDQRISLDPSVLRRFPAMLPVHEAAHALQRAQSDIPTEQADNQRYGTGVQSLSNELGPSLLGLAAEAQARRKYGPVDARWKLNGYEPSIEYLRAMAEKHGAFSGQSIDKLLADNPQFIELLARHDATPEHPLPPPQQHSPDEYLAMLGARNPGSATPAAPPDSPVAGSPGAPPLPRATAAVQQPQLPTVSPLAREPVAPLPVTSPIDVPTTQQPEQETMAQYGPGTQQTTPERRGNPYAQYGMNPVNPYLADARRQEITGMGGPYQRPTTGFVDRTSWANMRYTPGEQAAAIGGTLTGLPSQRASSALQDQGSPLAGRAAALGGVNQRAAASQAAADAAYQTRRNAAAQAYTANNRQINERLNPEFSGPVQANDARAESVRNGASALGAKYANYLRGARGNGNALSFQDFANAYAYDGGNVGDNTRQFLGLNSDEGRAALARNEITPAEALAANRRDVARRIAQQEAATNQLHTDRRNAAQFRMLGVMPNDATDAQRMMLGMAAQGNQGAGQYINHLMQETGLNNRANVLAQQQGANGLMNFLAQQAQLEAARRPTPEAQMKMAAEVAGMRPSAIREETIKNEIERQQRAMGANFNPQTAYMDAVRLGDQAATEAHSTLAMLRNIPELAPFIGAMGEPAPGSGVPAAGGGIPTSQPPATGAAPTAATPISSQDAAAAVRQILGPQRPAIGGETVEKPELNLADAAKYIRDYTLANGTPPSPEEFKATFGNQYSLNNIQDLYGTGLTSGALFPNSAQAEQAKMARNWLDQHAKYFGVPNYQPPKPPASTTTFMPPGVF